MGMKTAVNARQNTLAKFGSAIDVSKPEAAQTPKIQQAKTI